MSDDPRQAWLDFLQGAAEGLQDAQPSEAWATLCQQWAEASGAVGETPENFAAPIRELLAQWADPASDGEQSWVMRLAAGAAQRQLAYWQALAAVDPADPASRERLAAFHAASNRWAAHYADCLQRAATALEQAVAQREADVTRLRDYFNLWVDSFEAEHTAMLAREAYASDYAALVNAALRLRQSTPASEAS